MNPYQRLLDDPERLDAIEHTTECLTGTGIPWHQDPPRTGTHFDHYVAKAIQTNRDARKENPHD